VAARYPEKFAELLEKRDQYVDENGVLMKSGDDKRAA
jgi:hypothetical protein